MYVLISTKVHIMRPVCNCIRKILPRAKFLENAMLFLILYRYCELSARQKRCILKKWHCDILYYYKQNHYIRYLGMLCLLTINSLMQNSFETKIASYLEDLFQTINWTYYFS